MKSPFCPMCGRENTLKEITKKESINIKEETFNIDSSVLACTSCHGEFSNMQDTFSVIDHARAQYRKKHNIFSPDDLKSFMNKHNLSLRDMEHLTGITFKTIDRYLKGAIPDPSNVILLTIFMQYPQVLLDALCQKDHFKAKKFTVVKENLRKEIKLSMTKKTLPADSPGLSVQSIKELAR